MAARGLVVGAALVRGRRVLAARRTAPPEAASRWELPGGKVEHGETPDAALVRELEEELGCRVRVTGWLPTRQPIGANLELAVGVAELVSGEPRAREHDRLRWLGGHELEDVDWLEPDRPFLPELAALLRDGTLGVVEHGSARGIFFEEDDARTAAELLRADGHAVEVVRERLAGEDDDEDHPWAVLTDAPSYALEVLVDRFDGWLDDGSDDGDAPGPGAEAPHAGASSPPPPLPRAPRRRTRG